MNTLPSGTVTFLFTDVEGSTRRWDAHTTEMQFAMARHDSLVETAITTHGGSVFTTAGDAFCAAFSSPREAVTAAVAAQLSLREQDWGVIGPLEVRMALHTGNADERGGDYFGPPLNRCARLLSTGHGGQILVTAATAQLIQDELPADVTLRDLGTHELRDMVRSEHVFQVLHAALAGEFPPLRSEGGAKSTTDLLAAGREAHSAHRWEIAYHAFTAAAETALCAEDLQRLGEAAYWTGRSDESITVRERAYGAYVREGKDEAGALVALALAESYKYRLAKSVSTAWISRAERLLGESPETHAHGYLLRWQSVAAFDTDDDPESALLLADRVIAIGQRLGHRSLEALGLQDKGRFLVAMGRIDEGMRLVDEAMVAAVAGELDPDATGRSYCNMLAVCDAVADYQRASEWSDAAQVWCEQHSESAYPGVCRITRAELKWLRGEWDEAAEDLQRAVGELTGFTAIVGKALYQTGEIELRSGSLEAAERSFLGAHEHGRLPLPGLAVLRLREGKPVEAEQLLGEALRGMSAPLARARFLPALGAVQLELGKLDECRETLAELQTVADVCASTALRSEAAHGRAALAVREALPGEAVREAQQAIAGWSELQMPYEAARSRFLLGEAQDLAGNPTAARMEMETARSTFVRLGSTADAAQVTARLELLA